LSTQQFIYFYFDVSLFLTFLNFLFKFSHFSFVIYFLRRSSVCSLPCFSSIWF
jgi:hypothetical protein